MSDVVTIRKKKTDLTSEEVGVLIKDTLNQCLSVDAIRLVVDDNDVNVIEADLIEGGYLKVIAIVVNADEFPVELRASEKAKEWGGF